MRAQVYKLISGSAAEQFHNSRAKIRLYGGGFANGKTTALVAETLKIARDYPGSSGLLGRATYPKLNSTLRREFYKWCPVDWIKSADRSKENSCVLRNGSTIDFRYIEQQGASDGESTSNLLSANYDYIVIDQIDDVEINYEDFLQLLGRLRGSTPYNGDDKTMPRTGPRMIILSCNPTLGWPFKRIVKPVHDLRAGRIDEKNLICERDKTGKIVFDAVGLPKPLVEVFEASTYDNAQNLEGDYIQTLEATYGGKMRDRYLLGKWVAFDGVVYEEFDTNTHVVAESILRQHILQMRVAGERHGLVEGYDFGLTSPSCYVMGVSDAQGCVYLLDGFYQPNAGIAWQADQIKKIREEQYPEECWLSDMQEMLADPQIFKTISPGRHTVGKSIAEMFADEGIRMRRGNNNILNGITKVKSYLLPQQTVLNPFTHAWGSPKLFISEKLYWLIDEITTYRWKKRRNDETFDVPVDAKNHAMDALKYALSKSPSVGRMFLRNRAPKQLMPALARWNETEQSLRDEWRKHRYR